jgi:hypothetical protein
MEKKLTKAEILKEIERIREKVESTVKDLEIITVGDDPDKKYQEMRKVWGLFGYLDASIEYIIESS